MLTTRSDTLPLFAAALRARRRLYMRIRECVEARVMMVCYAQQAIQHARYMARQCAMFATPHALLRYATLILSFASTILSRRCSPRNIVTRQHKDIATRHARLRCSLLPAITLPLLIHADATLMSPPFDDILRARFAVRRQALLCQRACFRQRERHICLRCLLLLYMRVTVLLPRRAVVIYADAER